MVVRSVKQKWYLNRKLMLILVFSLLLVLCIIVIIYKLGGNSSQYTNIPSYKYIFSNNVLLYEEKQPIKSKNIQKLELLQADNSDIVALIEIEGTKINYPVVQTSDNSYYLTHDYKKQKSKDGAIMLDKDSDIQKPSTNLLIYGHNNIGSKEMFADLIKYKRKEFYENHKTIKFTTNEEEQVYEIICVFLSKVYYKNQTDVFKYYFFIDAKNKDQFDSYITNCKNLSLYDINKTAEYGQSIMTLSTCEYSRTNGRLVVLAKKIK